MYVIQPSHLVDDANTELFPNLIRRLGLLRIKGQGSAVARCRAVHAGAGRRGPDDRDRRCTQFMDINKMESRRILRVYPYQDGTCTYLFTRYLGILTETHLQ